MQLWISSIFTVSQDVNECILLAVDSVGLKEMPSYEVEMHDHTDWIKQTQESFHLVEVIEGRWIVPEWRKPPVADCQQKSMKRRPPVIGCPSFITGFLSCIYKKDAYSKVLGTIEILPQLLDSYDPSF
ncbi:ribosomal protein L11 methyltransferase-related [Abeliophyllum distichum]|uniref:Ribosomal protein L11 methyltransferase-related n=1 Tax=Abeliophyllum distichum TaxID=126358 RepID=A0ABD1P3F7_9LAMI